MFERQGEFRRKQLRDSQQTGTSTT
jgi:hypothetical protein